MPTAAKKTVSSSAPSPPFAPDSPLGIKGIDQIKESSFPKKLFQSLENARKIFPIIGKIRPFSSTIGKIFSNHWKTGLPPAGCQIGQNPGVLSPSPAARRFRPPMRLCLEDKIPVCRETVVVRKEMHSFGFRLGKEHPVERVPVQEGEPVHGFGMG